MNGRVTSTLPLNYGGGMIEDFTLWLEEGRIVKYEAKKGQELLAAIIETDEGIPLSGRVRAGGSEISYRSYRKSPVYDAV